jgi:TolA-binding protein|tara:strand:- start:963 stop:1736 length:774 start_codon:yes stop_codon:yes gene_type:complete
MTRSNFLPVILGAALLSACGPTQVVVTAEIAQNDQSQDAEPRALGDLEIRLFPYDRDAIFDSLTAAAARPEPPIPDSVLAAQNQVAESQQTWRDAEARWNTLRDTLRTLSDELDQMNRQQGQYRVLYNEFQDMEDEYADVEDERDAAFEAFTSLQGASLAAAQEIRLLRETWADEAYAEVGVAMTAHERASGLQVLADTTDANGISEFEAAAGDYWVTARYELPYTELYWNISITVVRGEPLQVPLRRDNASSRPKL